MEEMMEFGALQETRHQDVNNRALSDKRPYIICTLALTTFVHLHVHQARQVSKEIVSRGWKIIRLVDTVRLCP